MQTWTASLAHNVVYFSSNVSVATVHVQHCMTACGVQYTDNISTIVYSISTCAYRVYYGEKIDARGA